MECSQSNSKVVQVVSTVGIFAAATYYLTAIGGHYFEALSFMGESRFTVGFGVIFLFLSIALGVHLYRLNAAFAAQKKASRQERPYLLRSWFLLPFLILAVANIGFTGFVLGSSASSNTRNDVQKKVRIVLLLPLADVLKPAYQDGMRQMYGYAEFLVSNDSQYTESFEFVPFDHKMSYEVAKGIVEREVKRGTKYFICTMSKVSTDLSKNFRDIVADKYEGAEPILIITVASSPQIVTKENSVYRFYIRSQEEGEVLARVGLDRKINTVTYIVVNDPYGNGAADEFKKHWKGEVTDGLSLDYSADAEEISRLIKTRIKTIPEEKRKAIFIAHYGNGIDNIIRALEREKVGGILLSASTLTIPDWQEPIKDILVARDWYTCIPDYRAIDEPSQSDVIKNFTTHTLKRLVQAINFGRSDPKSTFDTNWRKAEVDIGLKVSTITNGDAVIPMRVVDKSYFSTLGRTK